MGLPKTHYYDAATIASVGEPVRVLPTYEAIRAVAPGAYRLRKGNRSYLAASLLYEVFGFRQWGKVVPPDGQVGSSKGGGRAATLPSLIWTGS